MSTNNTNKSQEPKTTKKAKKYAPNDLIECRSVTGGELILVGDKTKLHYTWSDYGDTSFVEYQDLQALQSRKSGFLTKPRFVIEDESLVEQWSAMLKPIYDKINNKNIAPLIISIPPMELQNEFAAFVEHTDKLKLATQQGLEKLETLKKALMQKYFG